MLPGQQASACGSKTAFIASAAAVQRYDAMQHGSNPPCTEVSALFGRVGSCNGIGRILAETIGEFLVCSAANCIAFSSRVYSFHPIAVF